MPEATRGPVLILDGLDCLHLAGPLGEYLKARARRDGGVPARLQVIAENVQAVAAQYRRETLTGSGAGTERFQDPANGAVCSMSATWLTVEQAADLLDCSPSYVRRLCRQRSLHSVRAAGRGAWRVSEAAVLQRLDEGHDEEVA